MNRSLALHNSFEYKPSLAGLSLATSLSSRLVENPATKETTCPGTNGIHVCKAEDTEHESKMNQSSSSVLIATERQTKAARLQIELALSPKTVAAVQPIASGISGAYVFRVTTGDGHVYCAKVVLPKAKVAFPAVMQLEHRNYKWAAENGLAPAIAFSDASKGILITDFWTNEMGDECDRGKEPRLSASLAVMRALHKAKPSLKECQFLDAERAISSWEGKWFKLSLEQQQTSFAKLADGLARVCIERLSKEAYNAVPCHGDAHPGNILFNSGTAWLIDWGDFDYGDAMKEVAYFAYYADSDLSAFTLLMEKYDPSLCQNDTGRARCYLALLHASRYLLTLRGVQWEIRAWTCDRIPVLQDYLLEDAKWLGLTVVRNPDCDAVLLYKLDVP
jgi:thiamine kinase-like enzyme